VTKLQTVYYTWNRRIGTYCVDNIQVGQMISYNRWLTAHTLIHFWHSLKIKVLRRCEYSYSNWPVATSHKVSTPYGIPVTLTDDFHAFTLSLQANAGINYKGWLQMMWAILTNIIM
jgi:hypothetical protein